MDLQPENSPQLPGVKRFWLNWLAWNALGSLVAVLLNLGMVWWNLNGFSSLPELVQNWARVLALLGGTVALAWVQQRALRRYLSNLRLWFLVTAVAGTLALLLNLNGTYLAVLMGNTAQYSVYAQQHAVENLLMVALAAPASGLAIGLSQWLVLRLEVRRAWRWVAWSAGGWIVYALGYTAAQNVLGTAFQNSQLDFQTMSQTFGYLVIALDFPFTLIAVMLSGLGLALLLARHPAGQPLEGESREDSLRKRLVFRLAFAAVAAWLGYQLLMILGGSALLALLVPSTADSSNASYVFSYLLEGVILGLALAWALGSEYRWRWAWAAATAAAFLLQGLPLLVPQLNEALRPILEWSATNFNQSLGLVFVYVFKAANGLIFWIGLGIFQGLVLLQGAGRRAWIWFLIVPAVELAGLLIELVFGTAFNAVFRAVIYGTLLTFVLRSGWAEELVLQPEAGIPAPADLEEAARVLQIRLLESFDIKSQVVVEEGALVLSLASSADAEFASDLALQQGQAQVVRAEGGLAAGKTLPAGVSVILTGDDIQAARRMASDGLKPGGLLLELFEEGQAKIAGLLAKHPGAGLALAVDGEVLGLFTPDHLNPGLLRVPGIGEGDASFYAAILSGDPLPFRLKLAEE